MSNIQFYLFDTKLVDIVHKHFEISLSEILKSALNKYNLSVHGIYVVNNLNNILSELKNPSSQYKESKSHIIFAHYSDVSTLEGSFKKILNDVSDRVCMCLFSAGKNFQTDELSAPQFVSENSSIIYWYLSELRCQTLLKAIHNGNTSQRLQNLSQAKDIKAFTWRVQQFLGLYLNYHATSILLYALNQSYKINTNSICSERFINALDQKWPYWGTSNFDTSLKQTIQDQINKSSLETFRDYCFSPWNQQRLELLLASLWE